jgi:hypothetical protein
MCGASIASLGTCLGLLLLCNGDTNAADKDGKERRAQSDLRQRC